jgi:hypothetical protein
MRPVFLGTFLFLLGGCAEHRLVVKVPNPTGSEITVNSTTTIFGNQRNRIPAECSTNAIDEVRVRQNLGQTLLSAVTLGFFNSVRIAYKCRNIEAPVGDTSK